MKKQKKNVIPICFATDDNYIPLLAVAIASLLDNSSEENFYKIYVLTTQLKEENIQKILKLKKPNSSIRFVSLAKELDKYTDLFHLRDYYSKETYYRIFIPNLFPQYKKVLYLDCDIVVLKDVAELYNTGLHINYVAAVQEEVMQTYDVFGNYVEKNDGIKREEYFNAGILLINCKKFRENLMAERFVDLLNRYTFRVVQDEDYLNILCKDHVKWLPLGWNKTSYQNDNFDDNDLKLVHYKITWRPWKYKNVKYEEYFWKYAKMTDFYEHLLNMRDNYSDEAKKRDEEVMTNLIKMAEEDANNPNNYFNTHGEVGKKKNLLKRLARIIHIKSMFTIRRIK